MLAGGPSNERLISLKSGRAVYDALTAEGLDAVLVDVKEDVDHTIKDMKIDVAFVALHGRFGEDGTVQKMLELAGIPYTGSGVGASMTAIDKIAAKELFIKNGIPVPRYAVIKSGDCQYTEVEDLGFPVIVKPQFEGSSIGMTVAGTIGELKAAVGKALKYGPKALVEEYIDGREVTVGILCDEPLPVIEITTKNRIYDYSAKYSDATTEYIVPADINAATYNRAQELGGRAHLALGCRTFSRVDMMIDKTGCVYVLEVNTIPGMTERSLLPKAASANGVSFNRLCVKLLEEALNKNGKTEEATAH